jgi:hypothetical protein
MKTNKPDINSLVLNDKLFRNVPMAGIFTYTVIEVRSRAGEDNQLVVRCEACSHGYKCELLLCANSYKRIICASLLNDDDSCSQALWHTQSDDDGFFVTSMQQAKVDKANRLMREADESVRKAEEVLARQKARRAEIKDIIDTLSAGKGGEE